MTIRNILICTTQVPFTRGGAESHVEGLRCALVEAGYRAEIVALPFKWYPPTEIMRGAMAWRMLDLSAANGQPVDLVIGMKFPAYLVAHEKKVLWILHQHRSAYNLWGTPFDDLSSYPEAYAYANGSSIAMSASYRKPGRSLPIQRPSPRDSSVTTTSRANRFIIPRRWRGD